MTDRAIERRLADQPVNNEERARRNANSSKARESSATYAAISQKPKLDRKRER